MHGLVFHGPRDIRYERYEDPSLTFDHAVILKVGLCSICGSDLHAYHGDRIGSRDYSAAVEPFCVGHEFIGEIVEIGPEVHRFRVGQQVLAAGGTGCGRCDACRSRVGSCRAATAFGLSTALQGGQAEYVQVPNADLTLLEIPEGVTREQAVLLTDALATAYFGISRADIVPGDVVAVVGLGPIGLLGIELAFVSGASRVIAIDPVVERRARAEQLGAVALEPGRDLTDRLQAATGGRLADRVFEASGAAAAVDSVPRLLRHGGSASFIGLPQGSSLPMQQLIYRSLTVRAGVAPVPQMWGPLIPLIQQGRVRGDGLFTHRLPLSEGAEGYRLFDARDDGVLKILFDLT